MRRRTAASYGAAGSQRGGVLMDRGDKAIRPALAALAGLALLAGVGTGPALAAEDEAGPRLVVPMVDSAKGQRLFVDKGCVLCHAVNKVGGAAGPALDAAAGGGYLDLTDFMARMWRGAFAMIELQGMELGYQLDFTGAELGHIAAFLADAAAQKRFSERDVPDLIRDMFIREPFDLDQGLKVPGQQ
jgi:mono/diheme cytochrome c family protein